MRRAACIGLLLFAQACGEAEGTDAGMDAGESDDAGPMDAGTDAGLDSTTPDAGTDAGAPIDAGPRTAVPVCYPSCTTPSDCDMGRTGFAAANFSCDEGHCVHLGCIDDDDCPAAGPQVCHSFSGEVPHCVRVCFFAADCVVGVTPSMDADNFECSDSLCRSTGCNSDVECRNSFGLDWACRPDIVNAFGIRETVPICVPTCMTAADCAIGAFMFLDEDNFDCADGVCQYLGCLSDMECAEMDPAVCR